MPRSPESNSENRDRDPDDILESWLSRLPDELGPYGFEDLYINPATGKHYTDEELAREHRLWPTAGPESAPPEDDNGTDPRLLHPDA